MGENYESTTKLTEFAPLAPEKKEQGVSQFISKFFKGFGKTQNSVTDPGSSSSSAKNESNNSNDDVSQDSLSSWSTVDATSNDNQNVTLTSKSDSNQSASYQYTVDVSEGRNLPNVLKRISNLLELKSTNLHSYEESELKKYWIRDEVSRECYECTEKFTYYRRKHHCRICGQIFCSQCCSQKIPGKIVGCSGDLRACTYCCKIVLSYLQSPDVGTHLTADLRALQEDLQIKFGTNNETQATSASQNVKTNDGSKDNSETGSLRRKISIGYQEEKFSLGRSSNPNYISSEERIKILRNSVSLRNLFDELSGTSGILLQTHRYRLRSYSNCFLGSEIVDWLISQHKASSRLQASSLCQALLEAGYIKCLTENQNEPFCDGDYLYRPQLPPLNFTEVTQTISENEKFESRPQDEPSWMQQIPHESSTTDSEAEFSSPPPNKTSYRLPSSSSSYMLDLNLEESTVHLMRPNNPEVEPDGPKSEVKTVQPEVLSEVNVIQTSQHREHAPASGWYNATNLRSDNGEQLAYEVLTKTFKQHEQNLIHQLLSVSGLSRNWSTIITPLVHEIVNKIQPDRNHDVEDLDIRHHVQFKKIPGDSWNDSKLIEGIVCTKNVAHRGMSTCIENPKILLLNCSLVYQRTEGKLMSLEPVILQEHEYLKNVTARIVALQPNIVLVHRNVSRIAQDILRDKNITLVLNVKLSVLERIAKCAKADLITAIDAHMGRSKMATCKKFYLNTFSNKETGMQKTLMFFEGFPYPHLGATVLLRGASKPELQKLKQVTKTVLFGSYNWRLEKSFLMDEFAQPPISKNDEFFNDSKETSPNIEDEKFKKLPKKKFELIIEKSPIEQEIFIDKKILEDSKTTEISEKKPIVEPIEDFSDPLHSNWPKNDENSSSFQEFLVQELPFSNKFRKALDETILSISPYLPFFIPYLETDIGRKCKLRNFFPADIYYSKQFLETGGKEIKNEKENKKNLTKNGNLLPSHPIISVTITTKITEDYDLQAMLASYRACGGRLKHKQMEVMEDKIESPQLRRKSMKGLDILDVNNHQRIAVLFCSFSHKSNNAPAFCVNPWVVNMYFYGESDIPLGCFLERYCFRTTYICQSQSCDTPMLHHVRRFVHNSGCISISLNTLDSKSKEEQIVMWTWCGKCSAVSPIVPMSVDTWSFSFAKYLELRFYTSSYSRRGTEACPHSLHHDHHQYFGYKNMVAIFKYSTIKQWEISLPPPLIETTYISIQNQQNEIINELKSIAPRGHEVFSNIFEKISSLPTEEDAVSVLRQQLQIEHNIFKSKIEEVQLKLTSPTVENKKLTEFSFDDVKMIIWPLEDLMVQLKQIIVEAVENWNNRLVVSRKKDLNIRKSQPTPQPEDLGDTSEHETTNEDSGNQTGEETMIVQSKKIRSLDHTDLSDENTGISNAQKGHCRSQSDGTVIAQNEEVTDGKKDLPDKKSMKAILSQLLSSMQGITPLQCPFGPQEHYLLPPTMSTSIIVFENELSSIIAYALDTYDYKKCLDELLKKSNIISSVENPIPSPVHKRKNTVTTSTERTSIGDQGSSTEKPSGLLSFLWANNPAQKTPSENLNPNNPLLLSGSDLSEIEEPASAKEKVDEKKSKPPYIQVEFQDFSCNFCCRIYYAERFMWLRKNVIPNGEEAFIRSLKRSVNWNARGGKSGSSFCKTKDDRFILKEMTKGELQQFLESGNNYFAYMERCLNSQLPTLLGKIVGVYQIIFRNEKTNVNMRINLLVMENLFYNRTVTHKFDLKGSMRNRLVNPDDQDQGEIVLLDENLLKRTCESPLYIYPHSKEVLTAAIQSDTEFLASQRVMDYSLLVGLDEDTKELVVGIIDYIRTFTWDKKIETIVKKAVPGSQGKLPTIISPEDYRGRFIAAMHRYFLQVPDRWTGLGKGLDYYNN